MEPVRIKYYGLVWMTKRTYLIILVIAAAFAGVLLLAAILLGDIPESKFPWDPALAAKPFVYRLYNVWTLGALLVLQVIDTGVVLAKFAQKEATQKKQNRLD